ncbi:hypothetical protein COHCIP112018_00142 [Cohnella sp. JJ-181]|nr:hypothetical protein COHCIP112018_00142 [Cohnella sp. JJ-181]
MNFEASPSSQELRGRSYLVFRGISVLTAASRQELPCFSRYLRPPRRFEERVTLNFEVSPSSQELRGRSYLVFRGISVSAGALRQKLPCFSRYLSPHSSFEAGRTLFFEVSRSSQQLRGRSYLVFRGISVFQELRSRSYLVFRGTAAFSPTHRPSHPVFLPYELATFRIRLLR